MKDRNVEFPNRFRLIPVSGTDGIYDIEPVPGEVFDEGTFLNKANLLKDATAALYGLGADAVPDDVLSLLSGLYGGLGNQYLWEKLKPVFTYTEEVITSSSQKSMVFNQNAPTTNFRVSDTLQDALNGIYTLVSYGPGSFNLTGKYFRTEYVANSAMQPTAYANIFYVEPGSGWNYVASPYGLAFSAGKVYSNIHTAYDHIAYVNSANPNAYPPAVSDGFEYVPLGQVGSKAQIATGSYVGTGTGTGTVLLPFEPILFMLGQNPTSGYVGAHGIGTYIRGMKYGTYVFYNVSTNGGSGSMSYFDCKINGKTVTVTGFDGSNITYTYFALG